MKPLRCACLLAVEDGRILLVRVRDNRLWYLPGGKIEPGETAQTAVCRETREELGIDLIPESVSLRERLIGPDLSGAGQVELVCFAACWHGQPIAHAEISAVAWWPMDRRACFAPAVRLLCDSLLSRPDVAGEMPERPGRRR